MIQLNYKQNSKQETGKTDTITGVNRKGKNSNNVYEKKKKDPASMQTLFIFKSMLDHLNEKDLYHA